MITTKAPEYYVNELTRANAVIEKADALFTLEDDDGTHELIDPTLLPAAFLDYYTGLVSTGYYNGWID